MADNCKRVVIVKDPSVLPNKNHHLIVDALASANKLVVLMSHGNKYRFPPNWILPANVTVLEYDLESGSIEKCVIKLREVLRAHGIDVHSRHLDGADPMPMPLAGSVLVMNLGTEISFVNQSNQLTSNITSSQDSEDYSSEWDLL